MRVKRLGKNMPLHKFNDPGLVYYKAIGKYLELLKDIPEVVEVRLGEEDTLYTIVSAPRDDDDVLGQVIDAELSVMRGMDVQPFLFHTLNIQRLPHDGLSEQISSHGELVWTRKEATAPQEPKEGIVKASKLNNPGLVYYQAMSKYLELVQEIPEVVEVRLSGDDELYAILSATPFDDAPCYRVYRAEGKVMDSVNPQPYRFRSVNAQELPLEGRDEHIRSFGDLVWKRQ